MVQQTDIILPPYGRGYHLITGVIKQKLPPLPDNGLVNLFIKHTSAALTVNENADPGVLEDMEYIMNKVVPEKDGNYVHTAEGPDDMPAHAKTSMTGVSLTIPVTGGQLNLGTWQGIYLCEFRNRGGSRKIVATVYG